MPLREHRRRFWGAQAAGQRTQRQSGSDLAVSGDGVLAIANSSSSLKSFLRYAETNTRDSCATQAEEIP